MGNLRPAAFMFSLIAKLFSAFRLPLLRLTKLAAPVPEGGNVGTLTRNEDTDVFLAGMKGAEKQKINGSSYMGQVNKIMSYKHGPYHGDVRSPSCSTPENCK